MKGIYPEIWNPIISTENSVKITKTNFLERLNQALPKFVAVKIKAALFWDFSVIFQRANFET